MAKRPITFVVDDQRDRDILRWLDAQDNKSAALREAIRGAMEHGGVSLGDIYQAVQELGRKLQTGAAVSAVSHPSEEWDEPADIAAALDGLGL
jgi:hypothetical protein